MYLCLLGLLTFSTKKNDAFLRTGVCYWKDAIRKFKAHQKSECHREAILKLGAVPVVDYLNPKYIQQKKSTSLMLKKIVETIYCLCRQGLALRGVCKSGASQTEPDSNLVQFLMLRALDDPQLLTFMQKESSNYLSPDIQNEIIRIIAHDILRKSLVHIRKSKNFTIMVDETTDVSNKEQCVVCIRWVDEKLNPSEQCIGMYQLDNTKADSIVLVIKDVLTRCNLNISDLRGQCYDGASTMKGERKGVATQILAENPKAVYVHCFGHSLNLTAQDMVHPNKRFKDCLDDTYQLVKLLRWSPKRSAMLAKIKSQTDDTAGVGVRTLCPTR